MKIGIVGSREYSNRRKIKEFIFALKQKFDENIEIVSGGQKEGADGIAKKCALEFDMKYVEFPPTHYPYNVHCVRPQHEYGKEYATWHYHKRNKQIAEYSDKIVAFIPKDKISKGTMSTIKEAQKIGKKVVIIN
jgi:predicted Rossmann fold nucleotide-binding protein DprA/Smf involved in DNA uptake